MARLFTIALFVAISIAVAAHPVRAGEYSSDQYSSEALTSYLHEHRLPLVGARVMRDADGNQQVVLYGFVATPFGKSDAETKARRYLNEPGLSIVNRINIRLELLSQQSTPGSSPPPADTSDDQRSDAEAYRQQQQQEMQQYLNQNPDPFGSGFTFGFGFGSGGSGFGFGAPIFPP